MAGFQADTTFSGGVAGFDLVEAIKGTGVFSNWMMAAADTVTVAGGQIATFNDLIAPGVTMEQGTPANRATLSVASFGAWDAAEFVKANNVQYTLAGATFDPNAAFSMAGSFQRRDADVENSIVVGTQTGGSNNSFYLGFTAGSATNFLYRWGGVSITAVVTALDRHWFEAVYDGANCHLRVDGGAWQSAAKTGAPTAGGLLTWGNSQTGSAGNRFDGRATDLLWGTGNVKTNATALALLDEYRKGLLGIGA